MSTNLDLLTESLRLAGVLAEGETASSAQGVHALGRMNRMLESWTENGIELGWFEQTLTTDTAPLPKWAERGVISKLAQDLTGTYPATLADWIWNDNENGYGMIRRKCMVESMKPASNDHLPMGAARKGNNILTDS